MMCVFRGVPKVEGSQAPVEKKLKHQPKKMGFEPPPYILKP
jgi:hypothetical protein